MTTTPDREAARIASRNRGLITYRQARYRAGLSEWQIRYRVTSRRWRKVQDDVYAVKGATASWQQSALAAQRRARTETVTVAHGKTWLKEVDDAVLTGRSALWLRGVRRLGKPRRHELFVGRARAPALTGAEVTLTRSLPASDVEVVDGVPTLRVPRLAVELCQAIADTDLVAVLDELLWGADDRLRDETHARAVALRRGRPGCQRLIELTAPDAAERFRSWLERHSSELFTASRLPAARWNLEIRDPAGNLIGIGDAVWEAERVVVELDGLRFHSTPGQRRKDLRKDRRLGMAGWLVLRYTWLDVVERPVEVVAELRAALTARSERKRG